MPDDLTHLLAQFAAQADEPAPAAPDTATRITGAALELFAERSYEGATTQAIARRAGVTEKTLFKHFGNKDHLFARTVYPALVALLEPFALRGLLATVARAEGPLRETVRAVVADRLAFARAHPAIVKMLLQEMLLRPAFREALRPVFEARVLPVLRPVFERARERGELADLPPEVAIRTIVSVLIGYVVLTTVLAPDGGHDDALEVERLTSLIMDGLAGAS